MVFNRDTFCTMPWSSILISPSGDFKICCFTGHGVGGLGVAIDDTDNIMNVLTHSIKDAMNSKWHKELRLAQSKNERHNLCGTCWLKDDASKAIGISQSSPRVARSYGKTNYAISESITDELAPLVMNKDGSIEIMPISLDIRFSNLCNAKCIMCGPMYSNLWYEDYMSLYNTDSFNLGTKKYKIEKKSKVTGGSTYHSDMSNWNDDPRWWNQFDELAPHLRHVYITGGEPFIQSTHDVFIQKLIDRDFAKNIVLEYDTNLSVINPKILNMLKRFKDVALRISIDDVDDGYDLIRYPLKFGRVIDNFKSMSEYGLHKNITNMTTCVGIHSIFAPIRIREKFLGYENIPIVAVTLSSPKILDIGHLPRSIKEKIIQKYDESNLLDSEKKNVVGYLKNTMNDFTDDESRIHIMSFVRYMDSLDHLRGTNWKEAFPDVTKMLLEFLEV